MSKELYKTLIRHRKAVKAFSKHGIVAPTVLRNMEIYETYLMLIKEHPSKMYVYSLLSERFKIAESTTREILKGFHDS